MDKTVTEVCQFHLRLTVEKMCTFAVFTNKYLRLYGSVTPILRMQLTVDTQRLKYITLPLKPLKPLK